MSGFTETPRLLLPSTYTPTPTLALGQRRRAGVCACGQPFDWFKAKGPVPKLGPCCRPAATLPKESPAVRTLRRAALRHDYTAAELMRRVVLPGHAVVAFAGGVTLFVGSSHFQARTLAEAMGQADDAGATP